MSDYRIPLMGKPDVELEDPMQVQARILQIQAHKQNMLLNQQHIQSYQLQNQERQHALDAEKRLSELIPQNTDENGNVNVRGVTQGMAASGHAAHGLKWEADQRANEAEQIKATKARLDNIKQQSGMIASSLGPIANPPP